MSRLSFGKFVDRVFWAILCAIAIYAADQLKEMGSNIADLNKSMAVVLTRLSDYDKRMDNQDVRQAAEEKRMDTMEKIIRE